MNIKKVLVLCSFIIYTLLNLIFYSYALTEVTVSSCQTLPSSYRHYKLDQDLIATGNCILVANAADNSILDLNGFSIDGGGNMGWVGIRPEYMTKNLTVKNGVIENIGYGFYFSSATAFTGPFNFINVTFRGNNYDLYLANSGSVNYINCTFENNLYLAKTGSQKFLENTIINQTNESYSLYTISSSSVLFNTSTEPIFGFLEDTRMSYNTASKPLVIRNLCKSTVGSSNLKLKLFSDLSHNTSTCLRLLNAADNVKIDLGGHRLDGIDKSKTAFSNEYGTTGLSISNGIISNWAYGYYFSSATAFTGPFNFENIIFEDNNYDIYLAKAGSVNYNNCSFKDNLYLALAGLQTFSENTIINQPNDSYSLFTQSSTPILFNTSTEPIFGYIEDLGMGYYTASKSLVIRNLCKSTISSSNLKLKLFSDLSHNTSTCLRLANAADNVKIDLGGHRLDGIDKSRTAFSNEYGTTGLSISNGIISNWAYGYYFSSATAFTGPFNFENIVFEDNNYDTYLAKAGSIIYKHCTFSGKLYLVLAPSISFHLNNFKSSVIFENIASISSLPTDSNFSGDLVGNYWEDFNCTNSSNSHTATDGDYDYTVCDDNDYNFYGGFQDTNPIITKVLIPQSGSGTSSSSNSIAYPFSSSIILSISIILSFFIIFG